MARRSSSPDRYIPTVFPCWRWQVAIGDTSCTFQQCPHFTEQAPSNCDWLDQGREFSNEEIAAQLDVGAIQEDEPGRVFLSVSEVQKVFERGFVKYQELFFQRMADPVTGRLS